MDNCIWTPDEDGIYDTGCGHKYELMRGTPTDNHMNYCTYCGKQLEIDTNDEKVHR